MTTFPEYLLAAARLLACFLVYGAICFAVSGVLVAVLLPIADRVIEGFRSLGARF